MAETCYCGCDREVTGEDLGLSETGQNIRMIHGTVSAIGEDASKQMSAWLQAAGSVADTHMRLLGRKRKGGTNGSN